jgi:hypothetical protein
MNKMIAVACIIKLIMTVIYSCKFMPEMLMRSTLGACIIKLIMTVIYSRKFMPEMLMRSTLGACIIKLIMTVIYSHKFMPEMFYEIDPWGLYHETYYNRNLRISVIS